LLPSKITEIVAGILHIGNINFVPVSKANSEEKAEVGNMDALNDAANYLKVKRYFIQNLHRIYLQDHSRIVETRIDSEKI
jgi:myosin heavy subunit